MSNTQALIAAFGAASRKTLLPHGYAQQYMLLSTACTELASIIGAFYDDVIVQPAYSKTHQNLFENFPNSIRILDMTTKERIASLVIYPAGTVGPERIDLLNADDHREKSYKLLSHDQTSIDETQMKELVTSVGEIIGFHADKKSLMKAVFILTV